jgi:putative ATP-dependent endonuclease of OLD family
MYISQLKLWNFRIYWNNIKYEDKKDSPDLEINFQPWLNALVWENDAWKSAIIDAIRLTLWTHAFEKNRINGEDDFHEFFIMDEWWNHTQENWIDKKISHDRFRVEIKFAWLSDSEAKNFIEWLWRENDQPCLNLIYDVIKWKWNKIIGEVRAWCDEEWYQLNGEVRELLKCTYLKPLRDAESELTPWRNSRLWQILRWRSELQENKTLHDELVSWFKNYKIEIKNHFENATWEWNAIFKAIQKWTTKFTDKNPNFWTNNHKIGWILDLLKIWLWEDIRAWLWSNNMLYMAVEMLHLEKESEYNWLKLWLIEELEAHLHPQAQLKVVDYLETISEKEKIQIIITTHSPNLASRLDISKLYYCFRDKDISRVISLQKWERKLVDDMDYKFMKWFLDVTKANLFFAKWIIFVEWPSEEILLPIIANKLKDKGIIHKSITEAWISIINISGTSFERYVKIFQNISGEQDIKIPIAIVTDLDILPWEESNSCTITGHTDKTQKEYKKFKKGSIKNDPYTKVFISEEYTLERCISKSFLFNQFKEICNDIHNRTDRDTDFSWTLLTKLKETKWLRKTEIAYRLGSSIENILKEDFNETDQYISYLIQAIIHVCWATATEPSTNWD